jgi:N-acetylglucosamine repressor
MPRLTEDWLRQVLRTFYQQRTLTRTDLLNATGLNPASASHAIRHLMDRGVVVKTGEVESNGGRARDVLDLNNEAGYFVAVDLEGASIRFALTNLVGDIRFRIEKNLEPNQPIDVGVVVDAVHSLLNQLSDLQRRRVLACGVSHPGMCDELGRITAVNLGWSAVPLLEGLRSALGFPVYLENAHRTCIFAERWLGSARGSSNSIYVIVGNGIGIGAFVDGKILEGHAGLAGEIGHITIDPHASDLCLCGRRGCLEAVASCASIARQYFSQAFQDSGPRAAHRVTEVFERARQGDALATSVVDRAASYLGIGLAHLVLLLNPEIIVLGGEILAGADLMLGRIRSEMERHTLPAFLPGLEIRASSLGLDIGLKGASALAFRESLGAPGFLQSLAGNSGMPRPRVRQGSARSKQGVVAAK